MKTWVFLVFFTLRVEAQGPETPCPTLRMLLPMNNFSEFLAMEDFNARPSNPMARVFPMSTVFQMDRLQHNSASVLCLNESERVSTHSEFNPKPIVSILGALGGSLGPTIGRTVTGDPSLIVGYSSTAAVDPEEVQGQIQEKALGNVRLLDQSLSMSMSMDLMQNLTAPARDRFGKLMDVIMNEKMIISGLRFQNILFIKDAASQSFVGRDSAGNELRIIIPSLCRREND